MALMVDQRIEFHQERSFIYEMNIVHILDIYGKHQINWIYGIMGHVYLSILRWMGESSTG